MAIQIRYQVALKTCYEDNSETNIANLFVSLTIEHCIIGETFIISSSPHILGAFYNNDEGSKISK